MITTEMAATLRLNKHTVRGVIEDLEEHIGPSAAFVATQHALALYAAIEELERAMVAAAMRSAGEGR